MANLTREAQKEAKLLHDLLWTLHKDLEAFSFGELRTEIGEALSDADSVVGNVEEIEEKGL